MIAEDDDPQTVDICSVRTRDLYGKRPGNLALELSLAQTLMQIDFPTPALEKFIEEQGKNFDRKKFDAFMKEQFKKTMEAEAL